jgi:hypothetical protein
MAVQASVLKLSNLPDWLCALVMSCLFCCSRLSSTNANENTQVGAQIHEPDLSLENTSLMIVFVRGQIN